MKPSHLRKVLSNIGEPQGSVSIPSTFATVPSKRLREIETAMAVVPKPHQWVQANESFRDEDWCEETQGVTFGGGSFYFSCNTSAKPNRVHDQVVYRYLWHGDVETVAEFSGEYGDHLGALDYFGGKLYCAMEQPVGVLEVDLSSYALNCLPLGHLRAPDGAPSRNNNAPVDQGSMPWCAVHPWNQFLYSSENGDDEPLKVVHAYDRHAGYVHRPGADIHLRNPAHHVQGGCFTRRGHLLLATDERHPTDPKFKLLRIYSSFNGFYFGAAAVLAQEEDQELEDVCYAPMVINDSYVQVHAVLLENVGPTVTPAGVVDPMDNIFFKHFSAVFATSA